MKYLKVFKNDSDREEFEKTINYYPIIALTKTNNESAVLHFYDENDIVKDDNGNDILKFPVYLVSGNNGQLGIDVYNYIISNNIVGFIFNTLDIYVNNCKIPAINIYPDYILFTDGGSIYDCLYPNGNIICECGMF